jgi:hypothetical protein
MGQLGHVGFWPAPAIRLFAGNLPFDATCLAVAASFFQASPLMAQAL